MATTNIEKKQAAFQWVCQPKAAAWIEEAVDKCVRESPFLNSLAQALEKETSTRLFDWVDHIAVPGNAKIDEELESLGFEAEAASSRYRVFEHPGAQLPRIIVQDIDVKSFAIALKVESVADFLMVRGIYKLIEGCPYSGLRRACVAAENGIAVWVVERHGYKGMEPRVASNEAASHYIEARELWQIRPRSSENEDELMSKTLNLAEKLVSLVGRDTAAWIVCEVERAYWQCRNTAGQLQKARQDKLGMGWANHDHHTFRSSRKHFPALVRLFEMLGFHCRERFYAGEEAGWGAQVMENSNSGLTLFLDVDLSPEEIAIDFAHHPLPQRDRFGTIGLWCALHGDSILKSGMHHLEAQFEFEQLRDDLADNGFQMMQPFSNFPYLKQAFTVGERWKVDEKVLNGLFKKGLISKEDVERFAKEGAIGSHMENLQRREGYKGFNQKNVSFIIKKTDPRNI